MTTLDATHNTTTSTAKIFQSGRSQAVRLPKEFRFEGQEVQIKHYANGVLLLPLNQGWQAIESALAMFEPDLQLVREDQTEQQREALTF